MSVAVLESSGKQVLSPFSSQDLLECITARYEDPPGDVLRAIRKAGLTDEVYLVLIPAFECCELVNARDLHSVDSSAVYFSPEDLRNYTPHYRQHKSRVNSCLRSVIRPNWGS
jgi:hypothetical protein